MSTAGLITFHFAHHYGAQLQAYATMRAVDALGVCCEIIDYRLPHTTRTNRVFKGGLSPRAMLSNGHSLAHYAAFRRRFARFEDFVSQHMHLSPQRYTSFAQLQAQPPRYDVYLAGSDQIWNPFLFENKQFDPAFFLAFASDGRRISYASSFGVPAMPAEMQPGLAAYLAPFSALSVREAQGADIVVQTTGQRAHVSLDPTLLLNGGQWGDIAAAPDLPDPYLLCYFISDPAPMLPYVTALAEKTGYPIVQLAGRRHKVQGAKQIVFDAGPQEFLGLFQKAACICTNSFHGALFSIQFEKPFYASISPAELKNPAHSRSYGLLKRLGLTGRLVTGLPGAAPLDVELDYTAARSHLEGARQESLSYLKEALQV